MLKLEPLRGRSSQICIFCRLATDDKDIDAAILAFDQCRLTIGVEAVPTDASHRKVTFQANYPASKADLRREFALS
jgi:hypothetical protein